YGIGAASGIDLEKVRVPPFLPDTDEIRNDVADYLFEIEWFDQHLARVLNELERLGELENTLIVVTSDNGMPFPRAKATAYNYGVHMPLAIRWGTGIRKPGRVIDDFVNHVDFAPTFLEVAGVKIPKDMTGRSLTKLFRSRKSGYIDSKRRYTVTGLERHVWARPEGEVYPRRAIHTKDYVYIRNYAPDRWPMGSADFEGSHQGVFSDIDAGASKTYMMANQDDPLFGLAFGKLPPEELYEIQGDHAQMKNLAESPEYDRLKRKLLKTMENYMAKTDDPRAKGESPWKDYPFYKPGYLRGTYKEEYEALNTP
ncbi:MAG: sulfatase/phosphatase domain-containing protein, partial [Verrucomicrobiota bacterium]